LGSTSRTSEATAPSTTALISSSPVAVKSLKSGVWNFVMKASTKRSMRARLRAASGSEGEGIRCEGYCAARKVATMADSMMFSELKERVGTRPRGLMARYLDGLLDGGGGSGGRGHTQGCGGR
jgi:hypothetical protein